jgi:hypothetical protein
MNSRGKPLTSFENFKSQFSDLFVSKKTDYIDSKILFENALISYQLYFAFAWMGFGLIYFGDIEKRWIDPLMRVF